MSRTLRSQTTASNWLAAASSSATDFGGLFLGLSLFLIVSALLLTALLFAFAWSLRRGVALLRGAVAKHGVQVVQTHLPGANFWGLLLQMRGVAPVVATVHNNEEFRYGDADNRLLLGLRKPDIRPSQHVSRLTSDWRPKTHRHNGLLGPAYNPMKNPGCFAGRQGIAPFKRKKTRRTKNR